tara:strand:- start:3080 stop:5260 length:2181 start_codon:yes stop_codon:yes gene_type:complete
MKKISISIFLILLIILIITLTILSTVGIETKRFNNLVTQKINRNNNNISLDLNSIKFKLDIKEISLFLETKNPKIVYRKVDIPAENIKVYINFLSLINQKNEIEKISLVFDQIDINQIKKASKTLKPSNFVRFLKTKAKKGKLNSEIEIYLNDRNQLDNFIARGSISDLEIETFKNLNLEESSFNFFADKTDILLKNFKGKSNFFVINDGDLKMNISSGISLISNFKTKIKYNLNSKSNKDLFLDFKHFNNVLELKAELSNNLSINLDETYKLQSYNFKNSGKITKAIFDSKNILGNGLIKKNVSLLSLIDANITTNSKPKEKLIVLDGKYSLNKGNLLDFKLKNSFKKDLMNLSLDAEYDDLVAIDLINYKKKKNVVANINLNLIKQKENLKIKNVNFKEGKNQIFISGAKFEKGKFSSLEKISVKTTKGNKKNNDFLLSYGKQILIDGSQFDARNIPKILSKRDNNKLKNINKEIEINLGNIYAPVSEILKDFKLIGKIEKGKFVKISSKGDFGGGNFLDIKMQNDKKNKKKYLEVYSDITKPLLTEYNFFNGLTGGKLLFTSIIDPNSTKSNLKIENFKVINAPGMVKLLTLADLGGLADLAEGDGISFEVLEINMEKNKDILKLNEILALGPSISVLMEGYQDQALTSLRGTLVPAKNLNRLISKIPVLGDIVIPKEVGEGLFGISFKMKGPHGKIKTTINPIRTVTPRFIQKIIDRNKKTK